jgi:hypothetical protein
LMQASPKLGYKLSSSIGYYGLGYSMQLQNVVDVQLHQFVSAIRGPHRDEVCDLGKGIDNHPYQVITSWGPWEYIDEIHTYVLPFPLRYG